MKKTLSVLLIALFLSVLAAAQKPEVVTALKGNDPVELVNGAEVKGSEEISSVRGKYRYLFATEANKALFEKSPDQYRIQLDGGCGSMGSLSGEGNPDRYFVFDKRIYIFASEQCRNTFKSNPKNYIEAPDAPPVGSESERRRARELIGLALKGFGGEMRVDGVKNVQTKFKIVYKQGDKETVGEQVVTMAFPNLYREEEKWGESRYVNVLMSGGSAQATNKFFRERESEFKEALEREMHHHPLAILKARRSPGFVAFAAGNGKVGEADVEFLSVGVMGATTMLAIDRGSGRVLQVSYRGRNGGYGEIVKVFSDFREVDGLSLPFKTDRSFNGKLSASPLVVTESIVVNGRLEAGLFEKPEAAAAQDQMPKFDLGEYQFAFLKKGPKWTAESTPETQKIQEGHMANIQKMGQMGKLMAAGPMGDNGEIRGIFIFKAASMDEAKALAADDPAVKTGRLQLEFFSWYAPKGIGVKFNEDYRRDPKTKVTMTKYFLAILNKGPKWTAERTPEIAKLQMGHLWNIRKMLDAKSYAAAGPLNGAGDMLGLMVISAASIEEAKALAEADPSVKAGHLSVDLRPWWVAKEVWE